MVVDEQHESIESMNSFNSFSARVLPPPLASACVCLLSFRGGGPLFRRARRYPKVFATKLLISLLFFFTCWYSMHFAGGAVATMRFQRKSQNRNTEPLPDFVFDMFLNTDWDDLYCDPDDNSSFRVNGYKVPGADGALFLNFILLMLEVLFGRRGHILFQRIFHISGMLFLVRSTVVGLTGLPNPNRRCLELQNVKMTYMEALRWLMSSFPHRSCGDLIFSGHTALISSWLFCFERHRGFFSANMFVKVLVWVYAFCGIVLLMVCKAHYTVDVVLGFWFSFFICEFYHSRAYNTYEGDTRIGRLIRRVEDWGPEWEDEPGSVFERRGTLHANTQGQTTTRKGEGEMIEIRSS